MPIRQRFAAALLGGALVGGAAAAPTGRLDQEQAVGLLLVSNAGEMSIGTTMFGRTVDPEVRALARRLLHDHAAANDQLLALVEREGIVPRESALRDKRCVEVHRALGALWAKDPGAVLDQKFVTEMIEDHQDALQEIDTVVLPALRSPEVRQAVTQHRATVADHLRTACTIGDRLGAETEGCPQQAPATN